MGFAIDQTSFALETWMLGQMTRGHFFRGTSTHVKKAWMYFIKWSEWPAYELPEGSRWHDGWYLPPFRKLTRAHVISVFLPNLKSERHIFSFCARNMRLSRRLVCSILLVCLQEPSPFKRSSVRVRKIGLRSLRRWSCFNHLLKIGQISLFNETSFLVHHKYKLFSFPIEHPQDCFWGDHGSYWKIGR